MNHFSFWLNNFIFGCNSCFKMLRSLTSLYNQCLKSARLPPFFPFTPSPTISLFYSFTPSYSFPPLSGLPLSICRKGFKIIQAIMVYFVHMTTIWSVSFDGNYWELLKHFNTTPWPLNLLQHLHAGGGKCMFVMIYIYKNITFFLNPVLWAIFSELENWSGIV